ncbi:hypothetical protein ACO0LL_00905 [Undibacterium sp. TC4M20W]|uniref:hypothetical protein n=1 Tax=unclassified Undibacterium TaxID=2630295 RepID=UPI003BEF5FE9
MSSFETLAIYFLCTMCAINIYVSYCILSSDYYEPVQKAFQFFLIWLLPLLGSLFCYSLAKPDVSHKIRFRGDVPEYTGVGLHGLDH